MDVTSDEVVEQINEEWENDLVMRKFLEVPG